MGRPNILNLAQKGLNSSALMLEWFIEWVAGLPHEVNFAIVMVVLLFAGLGIPLPEEIPVIAVGYLVHAGDVDLTTAVVVTVLVALVSDSVVFFLGRHFGSRVFELRPIRTIATPRRMRRANVYFRRWGSRVVFVARFLPGVRSTVFLTAGVLRMPYRKFLLFDGSAALIGIPINIFIVSSLAGEIENAVRTARGMGRGLTIAALVLAVAAVTAIVLNRRKAHRDRGSRRNAPAKPSQP